MNGSWPCEIEVLFGSKNRADFDALSDVDYLIADTNSQHLAERKRALEGFGFSVSDYTLRRLHAQFEKRTLFAAHLKLEGRVVFDQKCLFRTLTQMLDPCRDYSLEQVEASELFSPLEIVPDSRAGFMWALDHLAVAFRNAAIIDHARRGEFIFAYDELTSNYGRWGEATNDELHALKVLREAKHAYRKGGSIDNPKAALEGGLRAINTVLGIDMDCRIQTSPCFARISSSTRSTNAYAILREIEREIISHQSFGNARGGKETTDLMRLVRNPHGYLWKVMYEPTSIEHALEGVRALVT